MSSHPLSAVILLSIAMVTKRRHSLVRVRWFVNHIDTILGPMHGSFRSNWIAFPCNINRLTIIYGRHIDTINFTFLYNKLDMQSKFQHFQSLYLLSSEPIPLLLPF